MPVRNNWCDCGSANLANVWSSETRIGLSFNVVLEGLPNERTAVTVNTVFEGLKSGKRNLYASGNDTAIRLTCVSTGRLERELDVFIQKNVSPPMPQHSRPSPSTLRSPPVRCPLGSLGAND